MNTVMTALPLPQDLDQVAVPRPAATANPDRAQQAAEDFEAFFLSQMLGHMFSGIESNELFGGGPSEDIYRSLRVDEYGKILARTGGVGIASAVKGEILKMQESGQAHDKSGE